MHLGKLLAYYRLWVQFTLVVAYAMSCRLCRLLDRSLDFGSLLRASALLEQLLSK